MATADSGWDQWRHERLADVNRLGGDATLTSTTWLSGSPTGVEGVPGSWRVEDETVHYAPAADGVGSPTFEPSPAAFGEGLPAGFTADFGDAAVTGVRWPGIGTAVRLWTAARGDVERIEAFAHDPAWRIEGRFEAEPGVLAYEYLGHGGRVEERHTLGALVVTIGGEEYRLAVTGGARGPETVVADATNGAESYARGRFVPVVVATDGTGIIDFNYAFLPPCAFSDAFDCPLAPPQNRIRVPVRAGERAIVRSQP